MNINKDNGSLWFISNCEYYTFIMKPHILKICEDTNTTNLNINDILEYCITSSISDVFSLPVIYPRITFIEDIFYSGLKAISDTIVFKHIEKQRLNIFNNNEVKVSFNGRDLVITTYLFQLSTLNK